MKQVKLPIEGCKESHVEVKLMKSNDFCYENSVKKIQILEDFLLGNIHAEGMDTLGTNDDAPMGENFNFLKQTQRMKAIGEKNRNMFDFSVMYMEENHQMVRALGGLLSYIQSNRLSYGELDDIEVLRNIKVIKHFKL